MARGRLLFHTLLPAIFLILTLKASRCAAQNPDWQSINCGGDAYNDSITELTWINESAFINENGNLFGRAAKVASSFQNISHVMTTLRYFPENKRISKYCYPLQIYNGSTFLVRASFLYGNYDGLNKPPSFVLLFNYDVWTNVSTSSSATPVMHELTFSSKGCDSIICLAPHSDSNHTPFISTLELRPLGQNMYSQTTPGDNQTGFYLNYGLMLSHRINYGASKSAAIRYPDDQFDRIWEANTTGPSINTSLSNVGTNDVEDPEQPPVKVMATAITTQDKNENLTFVFTGLEAAPGLRVELHLQELVQEARVNPRSVGLDFPNTLKLLDQSSNIPDLALAGPNIFYIDQPLQIPILFKLNLFALAGSPLGPLLNAIEILRWTPTPLSPGGTFQDDVDALSQIQRVFELMGYGQGDPCKPNGYSWAWIVCSHQEDPPRIIQINLANFSLKGPIPPSINNLTRLQRLDLSNNTLTGEIPNLDSLSNLEYLYLQNNKLTGELPQSLHSLQKLDTLHVDNNDLCGATTSFPMSIATFTYARNRNLCNDTKCHCPSSPTSNSTIPTPLVIRKNTTRKYIYAISCLGAVYILSMLTLLLIYMTKWSRKKKQKSTLLSIKDKEGVNSLHGLLFTTKMFTYNEICNATLDFTTLLGEGGFGKVYRGLLPSGEAIAVKTLADASKQGLKEFSTEVAILSRVRHKNLVSLIGYCMESTYILIYEYIAKGNLRDLIYGDIESTDKPLLWKTRLQIALDASQGLEYLHTGCDPTIIHRDVKSSNILLTDKMQAKVADFGLSRFKEGGNTVSHVSTVNVVGTAGYLDPAYNATNQLTDKSDVYSFGVVLFELICGRAPIDMYSSPPHIVEWVKPAIVEGKVGDIVDPMLANGYKLESMWKVIDVAFGCVENDRLQRPNMSRVAHVLREALEIEMDPNLPLCSQDVSGSSVTSDGKLPTLQYVESLRVKLEPR